MWGLDEHAACEETMARQEQGQSEEGVGAYGPGVLLGDVSDRASVEVNSDQHERAAPHSIRSLTT